MKNFRFDLLAVISCLPAVCACTSPAIFQGSNGVVRYQQYDAGNDKPSLELMLVQETNNEYESIMLDKGDNAFVKKITPDRWKHLIEALVDECGFLDLVESAPPGGSITSPGVISVENEFGKWTLQSEHCIGECKGYGQDNYFAEMVEEFRFCFDNTFSLQPVEDGDKGGVRFFKEEQERLKEISGKWEGR